MNKNKRNKAIHRKDRVPQRNIHAELLHRLLLMRVQGKQLVIPVNIPIPGEKIRLVPVLIQVMVKPFSARELGRLHRRIIGHQFCRILIRS